MATKKAIILASDWKERVNWKEVKAALHKLGFKVYITKVYTGSDEDVVVFSNGELTSKEAEKLYYQQNK